LIIIKKTLLSKDLIFIYKVVLNYWIF